MFQNDEPTLIDLLGRNSLVEQVGKEISTCDAPQVYGIHGDWGLGKTSFMHALHHYLVGECPESQDWLKGDKPAEEGWGTQEHIRVVWFEAWRYQHEPNPIVALLQEIRTQLQWPTKFWNETKKLSEIAVYGALFGMESIEKFIGVKPSEVHKAGETWERKNYATQLPTHVIRGLLEKAISELLPQKKQGKAAAEPKLVILIDDLDRCESAMAYRLLEGIKIYLSLKNCVFVLGMDQHLIELAVKAHLPECAEPETRSSLASEYVEKICRCIWHLPIVEEPGDLLHKVLSGSQAPLDLVKLGTRLAGPDASADNPALAVSKVVIAYKCLPGNPRKIKAYAEVLRRFINCAPEIDGIFDKDIEGVYDLTLIVGRAPGEKPMVRRSKVTYRLSRWAALAVVFSVLYHFHRKLYRILEAEPAFFQEIVDWARVSKKQIDGERERGTNGSNRRHFESMGRSYLRESTSDTDDGSEPDMGRWVSDFADPMRGDIMRIGRLLSDLGDTPEDEVRECILKYTKSEGEG